MPNHDRAQRNQRSTQPRGNPGAIASDPAASAGATRQPSLAARIRSALDKDPRFDRSQMNLRVTDLNPGVRLDGWAARLADRKQIENLARQMAGNAPVVSQFLVGPPGQHPDGTIRQAVIDLMMTDRAIDPSSIQAAVTSGVVHLTGLVDTSMHRRYIGALCWWIPGTRGVQNDIQAIYPEPENDELLAETVQLMMDKDPLVDVTEILTLCKDGVITLSGTVAGTVAHDAAESDAWTIEGVHDVINQIEVATIPGAPPILGFGG